MNNVQNKGLSLLGINAVLPTANKITVPVNTENDTLTVCPIESARNEGKSPLALTEEVLSVLSQSGSIDSTLYAVVTKANGMISQAKLFPEFGQAKRFAQKVHRTNSGVLVGYEGVFVSAPFDTITSRRPVLFGLKPEVVKITASGIPVTVVATTVNNVTPEDMTYGELVKAENATLKRQAAALLSGEEKLRRQEEKLRAELRRKREAKFLKLRREAIETREKALSEKMEAEFMAKLEAEFPIVPVSQSAMLGSGT